VAIAAGTAAVVGAIFGGLMAAKSIDSPSGACTANPHEDLGGLLLVISVLGLAPVAVIASLVGLVRGPNASRVVGLLVTAAVVGMVFVVFAIGDNGTFHCGR
jgi:hypothetical protein